MTRGRRRKLERLQTARPGTTLMPLASAMLVAAPVGVAQQAQDEGALAQVVVTATKREENLQNVPLSITALSTEKLEELHVADFEDYAKFLPSLSYATFGPGFSRTFFRGVSSGENGNHSGPLPSVGMYLDEQPITTITGPLDIHIYDIARIEALAGPQGTLYGASSQAGTIRIITNKPKVGAFEAAYDLEGSVLDGEGGYVAQGLVNAPIGERAAIRLVGWAKRDPGYISNVPGSITYPTAASIYGEEAATVRNDAFAEEDYNEVDTYGARAALRIDLNDSWTVTPTLMGQRQKAGGAFAYDPSIGENKVVRVRPESSDDRWGQLALTIEGKIANLDVTYAGSYLRRLVDTEQDYSDYTYFYDAVAGYGSYWVDDDGNVLRDPSQYIQGKDRYKRHSHELRFATPTDRRLRFIGGLFYQRQLHQIEQRYLVDDLSDYYSVTGWNDTIWLTEQERVDRDYAVFGELSYDVTDKLTFTGGLRAFKARNSLEGFFGFSEGFSGSGSSGETLCSFVLGDDRFDRSGWVPYTAVSTAPCKNLDREVKEDGVTPKVNFTYRFDEDRMVYVTWAKGFRPGGVNRRGTFPPYSADFLKNYEVGWKTSWANRAVRFNGALFWLDWDDFQFSFLGLNGLTNIINAGGARIKGLETDIDWAVTDHLTLSGGLALLDAELTADFCERLFDNDNNPITPAECAVSFPQDFAPDGTELPIVPNYKLNLSGTYTFRMGAYDAHFRATFAFQDETRSALLPFDEDVLGRNRSYTLADFALGMSGERFNVELFVKNAFDERADIFRFAQCDEEVCGKGYVVTNRPRIVGVKFGQRF
jgi:iron complex outermembrane receptor protein